MEVKYREDRGAYRQHVRGMTPFVSVAVLYIPAVMLVLTLLTT